MFRPIGSLITPRSAKIPDAIIALQVRQIAQKSLSRVCHDLPPQALRSIKIATFKNSTLVINAPPLVAAELSMRAERLKSDINNSFRRKTVRDIRFRVF